MESVDVSLQKAMGILTSSKLADALTKDMKATGEQVHARHILVQTEDEAKKQVESFPRNKAFIATEARRV